MHPRKLAIVGLGYVGLPLSYAFAKAGHDVLGYDISDTRIEELKRGDQVVTSGGIIGKVVGSEKEYVVLEISNNVKIKVEPTHVTRRVAGDQKAEAA